MKTNEMVHETEQLELGFGPAAVPLGPATGERRLRRAAWWFQQMHRVVNEALDWGTSPPARPQQEWLPQLAQSPRLG